MLLLIALISLVVAIVFGRALARRPLPAHIEDDSVHDIMRGRLIVVLSLAGLVGLACFIGLVAMSSPTNALIPRIVRFWLTVALVWYTFHGSVLAYWLTISLFGLGIALVLPTLVLALLEGNASVAGPLLLGLMVFFLSIMTITFLPSGRAFIRLQQTERRRAARQKKRIPNDAKSIEDGETVTCPPAPSGVERDLRQEALDTVCSKLFIDPEWSVRDDDRLSWVGHRLCQTFSVVGPHESREMQVLRLSSTVPVIDDLKADPAKISDFLNLTNQLTVGDTLIWNRENGKVESRISCIFHEGTFDWRISQFIDLAIIQLVLLEHRADAFAEVCDGRVMEWSHPVSGERIVPDDILNVVRDLFQPWGQEPSRFTSEDEFKAVEEWVKSVPLPLFTMGASDTGIAIEMATSAEDTALIQLHSDQTHPTLGSGLLVTIQVRLPESLGSDPLDFSSHLNRLECYEQTDSHQYGAWCSKDGMLAHSYFLPSTPVVSSGISLDAAMGAVMRAAWVAKLIDPDFNVGSQDPATIAYWRIMDQEGFVADA
jgi:hypothetical protein